MKNVNNPWLVILYMSSWLWLEMSLDIRQYCCLDNPGCPGLSLSENVEGMPNHDTDLDLQSVRPEDKTGGVSPGWAGTNLKSLLEWKKKGEKLPMLRPESNGGHLRINYVRTKCRNAVGGVDCLPPSL
jgi:hypothetical protein